MGWHSIPSLSLAIRVLWKPLLQTVPDFQPLSPVSVSCKQNHSHTLQLVKKIFSMPSPHVTICRTAATNRVRWKMASTHSYLALLRFSRIYILQLYLSTCHVLTPPKSRFYCFQRMQVLRKYYYIKQFISFTGASLLLVAFGPTYLAESTANARYHKHASSLALNGAEHPVMHISHKLQALHFFSFQPFFFAMQIITLVNLLKTGFEDEYCHLALKSVWTIENFQSFATYVAGIIFVIILCKMP